MKTRIKIKKEYLGYDPIFHVQKKKGLLWITVYISYSLLEAKKLEKSIKENGLL